MKGYTTIYSNRTFVISSVNLLIYAQKLLEMLIIYILHTSIAEPIYNFDKSIRNDDITHYYNSIKCISIEGGIVDQSKLYFVLFAVEMKSSFFKSCNSNS